jgi:hypothetical protein
MEAGDGSLPATARHQGGWIMRTPAVATEIAFGRFGGHGTQMMAVFVVLTSDTDTRHVTDAEPRSTSRLRQSQVIDSKGH